MRGVRLGRVLIIAGLIEGIGLIANAVTSLVTEQAGGVWRWLLPPGVALVAAMVKALVDVISQEPAPVGPTPVMAGTPAGYLPVGPPGPPARPIRRRRTTPVLVAMVVVLLVCGAGGFAVTAAGRFAAGWVTGNERGTDRLVQAVSGHAGTLSLTVERVVSTAHFTHVDLVVQNAGAESLSLLLFNNCVFTGSEGTTLQADPFRSHWSDTVPAGAKQRGTVTFGGTLPGAVTGASLSFSQVFGPAGGAITVSGITLRAG